MSILARLTAVSALAFSLVMVPGLASADTTWLCRPGLANDPCNGSLATTVVTPTGTTVVDPGTPTNQPIDCFYVYPTVSERKGPVANKRIDAQLTAIANYQAARFSEVCKVYAPVYRQVTLNGILGTKVPAKARVRAYQDVRRAWRAYLRNDNQGRGVVLIGHSQGTGVLRQLIREEIDRKPAVRKRLVSALLIGGSVAVREGRTTGGDFRNIPICTSAGQTGCVITFATFAKKPPKTSLFGRVDAERAGLPTKHKYTAVCTNPAALAGGSGELTPLWRTTPFEGRLGLVLKIHFGAFPPAADTPWLLTGDRYRATCIRHKGASVLQVKPIGSARVLNASPSLSWGLHLLDINVTLPSLLDVVRQQTAGYGLTGPLRG